MLAIAMKVLMLSTSSFLLIACLLPSDQPTSGRAGALGLQRSKHQSVSKQDLQKVESDCSKGELNRVALEIPLIAYPPAARQKNVRGRVAIKVFINESGDVYHAVVMNGPALLRKAALRSALGAKFKPFIEDNTARKCAGILNYTFNTPD